MCLSAVLGLGSAVIGGISANNAADAQSDIARQQMDVQERAYEETTDRFQPFLGAGENALRAVSYELGLGERPTFGGREYEGFKATPGYEFRVNEGINALEGSAASRGGLFSGQTGEDLVSFGQGIASQEYNNFLNRLTGLSASGQNAAGNLAAAGQNFATGSSNALANLGDAQAAGSIGMGNALLGGINNGLGIWQYQQNMQNAYAPQSGYGMTTGNRNALSGFSGSQLLPPGY